MASITIRLRTESDDSDIVSIVSETLPHLPPTTVEEYRCEVDRPDRAPDGVSKPFVAVDVGHIVGMCVLRELKLVDRPDTFSAEIVVAVAKRQRGVGTALYEHVMARAMERGATRVYGRISEQNHDAFTFFEKRGFTRTGRADRMSRLKIASARLDGYEDAVERVESSGLRITTLAEIGENHEPFLRALHRMSIDNWRDIPGSEELTDYPYDKWLRDLRAPGMSPEQTWIVLQGERPIGIATVRRRGHQSAYNHDTGVVREFRGRGIARALKRKTIEWASQNGIDYIYTANDTANERILSINIPLGYKEVPSQVEIVKDLS
jgi:GNAT superfamily N-acetyltransferase